MKGATVNRKTLTIYTRLTRTFSINHVKTQDSYGTESKSKGTVSEHRQVCW